MREDSSVFGADGRFRNKRQAMESVIPVIAEMTRRTLPSIGNRCRRRAQGNRVQSRADVHLPEATDHLEGTAATGTAQRGRDRFIPTAKCETTTTFSLSFGACEMP